MRRKWFSGTLPVGNLKVHYWRTGGNKPPLVLLHGLTDSGLCWAGFAREMEGDFDVIMYDACGHGMSDPSRRGYSIENMASELDGLISALGLEKPGLAGHSLGASVAAAAAVRYPGLPGYIILEDPPWWRLSREDLHCRLREINAGLRAKKSLDLEQLIQLCRRENPLWPEDECRPWARSKLQADEGALQILQSLSLPWEGTARKIACPVLLITADPDLGALVTPEAAREASGNWGRGKAVRLKGAGHNIRRDQSAAYLDAIRGFLKEYNLP